ncbi:transposase [Lachnospiraceae bacterium 64-25]
MNKSRNFVPGFICVLHTFGRPLEWNPHIHCLLTEGGFSDDGFWRVVKHFNYTYLRKAFQTALLNELEKRIGPSFKKTKASIYKKDKNGFYVYAKPNLCDTDAVVKYISRYLGRPVIASSRIDSYDGENVTFHYNKHEDNSYVEKTVPVMDFISLLIQHIPEKHFKMTRYYGLYARHRKSDGKLRRAVPKSRHRILLDFNKWRQLFLLSFGYDPLQCPKCNHKMEFLELYHNHKPVSLPELYERTMAKYHCRSSGKCA